MANNPSPNDSLEAADSALRAERLWRRAYRLQLAGDVEEAMELYKASLEVCPTAEAHTFLGWGYSFKGRYHEAIAECHRAIEIDPDFGNPWNDIGAYLVKLGQPEDSIAYFERALRAGRYDARYYPHFNLGQVYEQLGDWYAAIREYDAAVKLDPEYEEALRAKGELVARLN